MGRAGLPAVLALGLLGQEAQANGRHFRIGTDGRERPGPTASQLAPLLEAFARADPLLCELAANAVLSGVFRNQPMGEESASRGWMEALSSPVTASDAVALLAGRLSDAHGCVRRLAAELLGDSTNPEALSRLRTALGAKGAEERQAAALGLGEAEEASGRELLEHALRDVDAAVAATAAWALGQTADVRSLPPLLEAARHPDVRVRRAAVSSLGNFEDARTRAVLLGSLRDTDTDVRRAAAAALSEGEVTPDVQRALRAALADASPDVRREAAQALGR
jgi:HEAT repeat protein